jgi:ABC-type antimicrobial peptide transport system permease subunit
VLDPRDDTPEGVVYLPARGQYFARATFYVRSRVDADALRSTVATVLHDLDPNLPVALVATLRESLRENMASVAQLATGAGAMGVVALLLAALGIATVMSFVVEQRRYEIGVRMALGARGATVARLFLRQALQWCAIGTVIGAAVGAAVTTLLRGVLFGLSPIDPGAFAASTAIIVAVALASTLGPARQAARIDPLIAIRSE